MNIDTSRERNNSGLIMLNTEQFKKAIAEDVVIIDTRAAEDFTQGFIPGTIFLGTDGKYLSLANKLFDMEQSLLFISNPSTEKEIAGKMQHFGFTKTIGFLEGGFEAWVKAGELIDMIIDVEPDELMMDIPFDQNLMILDVRKELEFSEGHLANACNIPFEQLADPAKIAQLEEGANIYLHCAGGNRSIIAASLLKRHGLNNIRNVHGGWNKIKEEKKAEIVKEGKILN